MRRGEGAAATTLALLTALAPAARAASQQTYRVGAVGAARTYEVYRTTSAPLHLSLRFDIDNPPHPTAAISSIGIVRVGNHWDMALNGYDEGYTGYSELGTGEASVTTYGTPASVPPCPTDVSCRSVADGSLRTSVSYTGPARLWFYFYLADATAKVTIESAGWKLRPTTAVHFRRLLGSQVSTGASAGLSQYEHFTEATLPGGRYGSRARGHIPCWQGGVGSARLTGGIDEPAKSFTNPRCPPESVFWPFIDDPWSDDVAFGPTTWRLKGDVTGTTDVEGRLMVFDFPKP